MGFRSKLSLATLVSSVSLVAAAFTYGNTQTYGGLTWSVSTNISGLTACTQLVLNATGDFVNTAAFALYGAYNCPALNGGYAATGVGYFGTDNSLNMTITYGDGAQMRCTGMSGGTLTGDCRMYDSTGGYRGVATVAFQ